MRILAIGIGGAGSRIASTLYVNDRKSSKIACVQALAVDVDPAVIDKLTALPEDAKICFAPIDATLPGATLNSAPAARIDIGEIMTRIQNREGEDPDAIMICCGLGGSLSDIVPPLIAALRNAVTEPVFGLVTLPCISEGERRSAKAADDIEAISPLLDGTILFDNETWEKKIATRRDALVKELSESKGFLGFGNNAPRLTPEEVTQKLLNQNIVRRISLILKAGEFKADGGMDLAEVVLDSSEILNTMMGMGFITIGYAVENLQKSSHSFLSKFKKANETEEQRKSAERIIELAKHAIYNEVSIPCDMTSAAKALILVAGPSHEISMKGYMTVRKWIDRSIAGMETRSGDYPVTNNKSVAIIVMLSGIENIPRVNEIKEVRDRLKYGNSPRPGPVREPLNLPAREEDRYATIVTAPDETMAWQPSAPARPVAPGFDPLAPHVQQQPVYNRQPEAHYIPPADRAVQVRQGDFQAPVTPQQYIPDAPARQPVRQPRAYPEEQRRVIREQPVIRQEPVQPSRQVQARMQPQVPVSQPVPQSPRPRVIPQENPVQRPQIRQVSNTPVTRREPSEPPLGRRGLESGYESVPVSRRPPQVHREPVPERRERTLPHRADRPADEPVTRQPVQPVRVRKAAPAPQEEPVARQQPVTQVPPQHKMIIRRTTRRPVQQEYVPAEPVEEPVQETRVVRVRKKPVPEPVEEPELPDLMEEVPAPDSTLPHLQDSYQDLANPDKSETRLRAQITEGAQIGLKGRSRIARDDIFLGKSIAAKKPSLVRDDALLHAGIKSKKSGQKPPHQDESEDTLMEEGTDRGKKRSSEKTVDDDLSWIND